MLIFEFLHALFLGVASYFAHLGVTTLGGLINGLLGLG